METFHVAHAASPDWLQAANSCLAQLDDASPGANLGFLYVTDGFTQQLPRLLDYLKEQTDIEDWVGTVGIGICATGKEYYDEPALSIMLAEFPPDAFRVFPSIRADIGEFTLPHRAWCEHARAHFAIVHGDPRNPNRDPNRDPNSGNGVGSFLSRTWFWIALAVLVNILSGYFRREQIRTKRAFEPTSLIGTMRPVTPSGD